MESIENVLEKLKTYRKNSGISHEDIAFKLNISQAAYTNIENQNSKLSVERLLKIAEILQKPVYSFFNETPKTIYNQEIKESSVGHQEAKEIHNIGKELLEELIKSKDEQIAMLKDLLFQTKE